VPESRNSSSSADILLLLFPLVVVIVMCTMIVQSAFRNPPARHLPKSAPSIALGPHKALCVSREGLIIARNVLRVWRALKPGVTAARLALSAGIHAEAWRQTCRGQGNPTMTRLCRVAAALGCCVGDLVRGLPCHQLQFREPAVVLMEGGRVIYHGPAGGAPPEYQAELMRLPKPVDVVPRRPGKGVAPLETVAGDDPTDQADSDS
jgi:hypothetical protein